jgi:uncharacterized protein (TIGR02598 family)
VRRAGFTLLEVVIAIGLCSGALLTIFALLPLGMDVVQDASRQVAENEIFNRLWSQFNTTPFSSLQNWNGSVSPIFMSPTTPLAYYYDAEGQDITPSQSGAAAPEGAVYIARCALENSQTNPTLSTTVPMVDGGSNASGASLTFVKVQIGFHFDPVNLQQGRSDYRVVTRNFLLAKRDSWNGN